MKIYTVKTMVNVSAYSSEIPQPEVQMRRGRRRLFREAEDEIFRGLHEDKHGRQSALRLRQWIWRCEIYANLRIFILKRDKLFFCWKCLHSILDKPPDELFRTLYRIRTFVSYNIRFFPMFYQILNLIIVTSKLIRKSFLETQDKAATGRLRGA